MKFLKVLLSAKAALVYLVTFAVVIGAATFIENDFGTSSAQAVVYQSWWFELLLVLFGATLISNAFKYKLIQRKQYSILIFHLSIIVILAGSAITRYYGWEGVLHIREGERKSEVVSRDSYLSFSVSQDGQYYASSHKIFPSSFRSGTSFFKKLKSPLGEFKVSCLETFVDPKAVIHSDGGDGAVKVVFGGVNGRTELALTPENSINHQGVRQSFSDALPTMQNPFVVRESGEGLLIASIYSIERRIMATGAQETLEPNMWHPLVLRSLHSTVVGQFVFAEYEESGSYGWQSQGRKITSSTQVGLKLLVEGEHSSDTIVVFGSQGLIGNPVSVVDGDVTLKVSLGSTKKSLPFSIALDDFQMTRYPGTDAPASFASQVRVLDPNTPNEFNYNIHMNHILDYDGYRFFQSSYDQDELGSYLSVNQDFYGTWVTYLGYFLLTLGMVWALFSSNTRFKQLRIRASGGVKAIVPIILMLVAPTVAFSGQTASEDRLVVDEVHAVKMSRVLVQDFRGRIKPMHTMSREILRKISGKEEVIGLTADQFMLSSVLRPSQWYDVSFIKQGASPVIHSKIGTSSEHISYNDCFDANGQYLLRDLVKAAHEKKPTEKDANDKALIALDERVNILNMLFSGHFLKWVPLKGDPNNTWAAPSSHGSTAQSELSKEFFNSYFLSLEQAFVQGDYSNPNTYLDQLISYQQTEAADIVPLNSQLELEIWLNNFRPFNKLAGFYGILALVFLILLFVEVFVGESAILQKLKTPLFLLAIAPFVMHTAALGIRWFVSERAPWSNGYESLIYIGWTSSLSGLIFSRKEWGVLASTYILSATLMLIAMLSYLNPEITPLVPVLKSYWLTIHVSLEAGSYGFLMLGAVIGILILILTLAQTTKNKTVLRLKINRLHAISELTITAGLYMLSIGTYLGGLWANESWGRYWGWDAKETWALVSILVYAFILHMRFIPKLNNAYAFSVGSLFGLASIVMTYFGVNYYLSGLHSYAAGDPVPIPSWVYILTSVLIVLSIAAYFKRRALSK